MTAEIATAGQLAQLDRSIQELMDQRHLLVQKDYLRRNPRPYQREHMVSLLDDLERMESKRYLFTPEAVESQRTTIRKFVESLPYIE